MGGGGGGEEEDGGGGGGAKGGGAELEEMKKDLEDNLVDHIPVKMIRYDQYRI